MNSYFQSLTIFLILPFLCRAQDEEKAKWRISTQPAQLLFLEIPITAERVYERYTIGGTLGYRIGISDKVNLVPVNLRNYIGEDLNPFLNGQMNAVTLGVNAKRYVDSKNKWFLESQVFYRRWWRNESRDNKYPEESYEYTHRTPAKNVFGTKFLVGYSKTFPSKGSIKPVISGYAGLGVRVDNIHKKYITTYPLQQYSFQYWWCKPSLHLGFTVGMEFTSKQSKNSD